MGLGRGKEDIRRVKDKGRVGNKFLVGVSCFVFCARLVRIKLE